MTLTSVPVRNLLIEMLPAESRTRFLAGCELVELKPLAVLCTPGGATRHVYFPVAGMVSLTAGLQEHGGLEVGMVGHEGMVGVQLALDVSVAPLLAQVQSPGMAWRIGAPAFAAAFEHSQPLRAILQRYLYVLMGQLAAAACCLQFHQIGPRLAKCLLMHQDRAEADRFVVTHEALAQMLGVRRVSVTRAAGDMQRDGLIVYQRGHLRVTDRPGLEAAACGCYAMDRKTYADVLTRC